MGTTQTSEQRSVQTALSKLSHDVVLNVILPFYPYEINRDLLTSKEYWKVRGLIGTFYQKKFLASFYGNPITGGGENFEFLFPNVMFKYAPEIVDYDVDEQHEKYWYEEVVEFPQIDFVLPLEIRNITFGLLLFNITDVPSTFQEEFSFEIIQKELSNKLANNILNFKQLESINIEFGDTNFSSYQREVFGIQQLQVKIYFDWTKVIHVIMQLLLRNFESGGNVWKSFVERINHLDFISINPLHYPEDTLARNRTILRNKDLFGSLKLFKKLQKVRVLTLNKEETDVLAKKYVVKKVLETRDSDIYYRITTVRDGLIEFEFSVSKKLGFEKV